MNHFQGQLKLGDGKAMSEKYFGCHLGPIPQQVSIAEFEQVASPAWTETINGRRWVRVDGAVVRWDDRSPYPNPCNPRSLMWTAWEPDPSERYIGKNVGRRGRRHVPRRFKTAEAAMREVDQLYPLKQA